MTNKKYLKPLAVGLLATNIIGFGTQTVAFAATDKAPAKEQAQKNDALKKAKGSMISFAANDNTEELSDLERALEEALKENNGVFDENIVKKTEEKAASMHIEFDYLEFLKAVSVHTMSTLGEVAAPATGDIPVLALIGAPLVDALFPQRDKVEEMWDALKPRIEALIDEKLDERLTKDKLTELKTKLEGSAKRLQALMLRIKTITGHGDDEAVVVKANEGEPEIVAAFDQALGAINESITAFTQEGYEIASLPLYVQMANLHLGILKDAVVHGKDLGIPDKYINEYNKTLKKDIKEYTNYVYTTFNTGLEKMKKNTEHERSQGQWNKVNGYVRAMTASSLDFASLWPTMDVDSYNQPTHLEQTRQVFGDIPQWASTGNWDYNDILNVVRGDGYRGQLKELNKQAYVGDDYNDRSERTNYLKEVYWEDQYTWDTNEISWGEKRPRYGKGFTSIDYSSQNIDKNPITKDSAVDNKYMFGIDLDNTKILPGHKLMKLVPVETNGPLGSFVMSTVRKDVPLGNFVNEKEIVGIPAEKRILNKSNFATKSEYMNGANVMVSEKAGDKLVMQIQSKSTKKYKIRYHVATNTGTSLVLSLNGNTVDKTTLPNTEGLKDKENVVTGAEGAYTLVDGPVVTLNEKSDNSLEITSGGGKIALDRVEFVPTDVDNVGLQLKTIDGVTYCVDKDGNHLTGWQTVSGREYYFNKTGDGSGMDHEGEMATGFTTIGGVQYYFNKTGDGSGMDYEGEMATGFKTIDGKTYYFGQTGDGSGMNHEGQMATGWKTIDGKKYYFNKTGDGSGMTHEGEMATGFTTIDGVKYYFGKAGDGEGSLVVGEKAVGWKTIDGVQYYFGKTGDGAGMNHEGEMAIGWKMIDGVQYYFGKAGDGEGSLVVGQKAIGWKTIDGVKYYFNRRGDGSGMKHEGEKAIGKKWIDGSEHYFNQRGDGTGYKNEGEMEY